MGRARYPFLRRLRKYFTPSRPLPNTARHIDDMTALDARLHALETLLEFATRNRRLDHVRFSA